MRYGFKNSIDGDFVVDTRDIDYDITWNELNLNADEKEAAYRIIESYHLNDHSDRIIVIDAYTLMKPINREEQRHAADHYKTRRELEIISRKASLLERLIESGVLELHSKWWRFLLIKYEDKEKKIIRISSKHKRHPQAMYRINPNILLNDELE